LIQSQSKSEELAYLKDYGINIIPDGNKHSQRLGT
jgi:hypothetical protein